MRKRDIHWLLNSSSQYTDRFNISHVSSQAVPTRLDFLVIIHEASHKTEGDKIIHKFSFCEIILHLPIGVTIPNDKHLIVPVDQNIGSIRYLITVKNEGDQQHR